MIPRLGGEREFMAAMGQVPGPTTKPVQDGGLLSHMLLCERWGRASSLVLCE